MPHPFTPSGTQTTYDHHACWKCRSNFLPAIGNMSFDGQDARPLPSGTTLLVRSRKAASVKRHFVNWWYSPANVLPMEAQVNSAYRYTTQPAVNLRSATSSHVSGGDNCVDKHWWSQHNAMTQLLGNAAFLSLLDVEEPAKKPSWSVVAEREMASLFGGDLTRMSFCAMAMPYNQILPSMSVICKSTAV